MSTKYSQAKPCWQSGDEDVGDKSKPSGCWPLRAMSTTMRSDLQGVKEDFDDASPSSKMRCTRFEACEVDDHKSRECMLAVKDEVDKKSLRRETTKRVCGPSKESKRLSTKESLVRDHQKSLRTTRGGCKTMRCMCPMHSLRTIKVKSPWDYKS